jgi:glutathione S-transferase
MISNTVILYRYDASPFSVKIDNILLLKNVSHHRVDVAMVPPRPEITELLGVGYRRIPILAIGNDVYCNTSLIASALERRFPASNGYGTLFPARQNANPDTGMIKAFSQFYADQTLFNFASSTLPWEKLPSKLVNDRSALRGVELNPQYLAALRPHSISTLSSHLALLEEQLSDGRDWLFDTTSPSLADVSVHFVYLWIKPFRTIENLFDPKKVPNTLQWMDRLSQFIERKKTTVSHTILKGDEAARVIASSQFEPYDVVGFDEVEAKRLGLRFGSVVGVSPTDTGKRDRK